MAKSMMLVLGNGFTIDFLKTIGKTEDIDVINLFRKGDFIPWVADNEPGFLSFKRCPNLWGLGARTNISNEEASRLIEDIITCAHVYMARVHSSIVTVDEMTIYIKAYNELIAYLRYLFSYYNSLVNSSDYESNECKKWGWYQFFDKLSKSATFDKVYIVTYNYDIFLERLLQVLNIPFDVLGFEDTDKKFQIMKPHGSISFRHKKTIDNDSFAIKHNNIASDGSLNDLVIDYEHTNNHTLVNPLIPPSGESGRFSFDWATKIKNKTIDSAKSLIDNDELIVCGISYWHVDRVELDQIFLATSRDVNLRIVNPNTSSTLNALASSIFKNYINYSWSKLIHKIL